MISQNSHSPCKKGGVHTMESTAQVLNNTTELAATCIGFVLVKRLPGEPEMALQVIKY